MLQEELLRADADKDVHGVVISGNPESPDFCSGYYAQGGPPKPMEETLLGLEAVQRRVQTIFDMHKPVVAKVHGRCLAGGTDLAFMSDMVIAANDASFAFPPHRDFGHSPSDQWIYHCGPQWAKRLLLTGDAIGAPDAARIGLILKSVPIEALDREVTGLMQRLSRIDPALLSAHKRAVNLAMELMGARTFQRLALEIDARAHLAPHAIEVKERGGNFIGQLKQERLDKFGAGNISAREPDPYDDEGRLP
jgi:enoyl-CoA hydratase